MIHQFTRFRRNTNNISNIMSVAETWDDMRLDSRLVEAIKALKWKKPTLVQRACIPEALRGRDVSVQARTGTGKTGAFMVPIIQRLLNERELSAKSSGAAQRPCAVVFVPSLELAQQTAESATSLCKYVKPRIVVEDACKTGRITDASMQGADIVVTTATAMAKSIKAGQVTAAAFASLRMVVIDEADWLIDIASIAMQSVQSMLAPLTLQVIMVSATLSEGVASMKGHLLHNPTNITLTTEDVNADGQIVGGKRRDREEKSDVPIDESNPIIESRVSIKDTEAQTLKQHYLVASEECHEHTLLYGLYRLKLISGKTLIFVDDEEKSYEIQNFLEQLGVTSAVYDTSLPVNIRIDVLRKFQTGEIATMLCTDSTLERAGADLSAVESESKPKKARKERRAGAEQEMSALHRGIDFTNVTNIIIFDGIDYPSALNFNKYTHRVGRAGRAGEAGHSILILRVPQAQKVLAPLKAYLQSSRNEVIKPFKKMDRTQAAKMQYRVDTVLANVTRTASRRIRVANVASELARSNYLSSHMTEKDTDALKKIVNGSKRHVRTDKSLLELPKYMDMKADTAKSFMERVNTTSKARKDQQFREATKKVAADPLKAVVKKVRQDVADAKLQERKAKRRAAQQGQ